MVHSSNGEWRLEITENLFQLYVSDQLAWQNNLEVGDAERRTYLSDQGWCIVETQGIDWGEVLIISPQGEICVRIAIADSANRPTWPPSHLHHTILTPESWPWNDGGNTPWFFATHEGQEFFWWLLSENQRLAFGFHPPRKLDGSDTKPLNALMRQHEIAWALSEIERSDGRANIQLRWALAVVVHQECLDALPHLHWLSLRMQREAVRKTRVPPFASLCPAENLLKLAVWILDGEGGQNLPALAGLNSEEVFAVAGPPDHIGWWHSDDRSEMGEFWDYYQPRRKVLRVLWPSDHRGDRSRHLSLEEIAPLWADFRADLLVKGWLEDRLPPSLHYDYPPEPDDTPMFPIVIRREEVQCIEVFGHYNSIFALPTQKLTIPAPYQEGGPVERLLRALEFPHREPSPEQFGWSRPRLKVEFTYCACDDNPSFLIRLRLNSGQLLQLKSDSYFSHMLPWRCRLDAGEIIKTYNREVSLAVAELVNNDFLNRPRLLEFGGFLERYYDDRTPFEETFYSYRPQPVPKDPNALDEDKKTALMRASHDEKRFQQLVANGADLEVRGQQGLTGLQLACKLGNLTEAERWLRYCANLETLSESGHTALMLAANEPKILKLLIDHGALIDATDKDGDSALDQAVCAQNLESIELLLAAGATSSNARQHALRCLAGAQLELERLRAYQEFHTPAERRQQQAEREVSLAGLKAKYPETNWDRNPIEDAVIRAHQIVARIDAN